MLNVVKHLFASLPSTDPLGIDILKTLYPLSARGERVDKRSGVGASNLMVVLSRFNPFQGRINEHKQPVMLIVTIYCE